MVHVSGISLASIAQAVSLLESGQTYKQTRLNALPTLAAMQAWIITTSYWNRVHIQTFPYLTTPISFPYSNAMMAFTNFVIKKRDGKKTNKRRNFQPCKCRLLHLWHTPPRQISHQSVQLVAFAERKTSKSPP